MILYNLLKLYIWNILQEIHGDIFSFPLELFFLTLIKIYHNLHNTTFNSTKWFVFFGVFF